VIKSQSLLFRQITSDNGLSTNLVNCIVQDSKGFMWFGTQDGLNRYDGYHFKVYKNNPNSLNSLSYSEVNCLLEMPDKSLLFVGTPNGLNLLNLTNDSIIRLYVNPADMNAPENHINVIRLISKEQIALGTNRGVFLLDIKKNSFQPVMANEKKQPRVSDILYLNNELIVSSDKSGLWQSKLSKKELYKVEFGFELVKPEDAEDLNSINKMQVYAGKLFLATNGGGLFKVDPNNFEIELQKKFRNRNSQMNYVLDFFVKKNVLYAGTDGAFLTYNLISGDTVVYIKNIENKNSINDNKSRCVYEDLNENIWIGTYFGGVNVSFKSSQKFVSEFKYKTTSYKNLFLTYQDKQGNVWLSGDRSLRMLPFNGSEFRNYSHVNENIDVLNAFQENKNVYWFGTYGRGLKRYDASTNKVEHYLKDINGCTVLGIQKIKEYLLIATFGDGLFKLDLNSKEITRFSTEQGLPSNDLTGVFVDVAGKIWLLSDGAGACCIDELEAVGNKIKILKHLNTRMGEAGLPSDAVYAINQDSQGKYWLGTSNGLSRYDGKNFLNFYESDGLASTFIYSILRDSTGKFWMSTNRGVTAFNPIESNKPFFKNYNIKDGLVNTEHNLGAACLSSTGNMLFGGPNGYNLFRPSQIKDNLHVPPVHVISFKRSGKDVALDSNLIYKKQLTLSWRENYFQLELAALDFVDPEKNLYKYKLEGYDQDWSEPSTVRFISYTELPGGNYTLKIKASNSDGVWNETPYELHIIIVPPFWKTTWFYVLVIVLGTTSVVVFTQLRTRQIKKENKILESKVAERTKELAEKNRDITSSIEYAKRIQEAILPSRDYIFSKLEKTFILYKPKDIVSGDFYWFGEKDGWRIFAVVDCTGHGVPGAFMSMIGHNLMNQIVQEKGITEPGEILNALHKGVQDALRQGSNEINTNDGMDVSLISIHQNSGRKLWAGANRPLVIVYGKEELIKLDGNKYPIGGSQFEMKREFTTHELQLKKAANVYMFSDGYADQFGGDSGKKFMVRRFHQLLQDIYDMDAQQQKNMLQLEFDNWRNEHEQIDDVLVVGIAL
jgi:ligand-binding sensor domain-containing protein/serine phosphatase RsbU (regulator of sigma subunit)